MAGVTAEGLVIKTTEEVLSSVEASEIANIDPELDTSPSSPIGGVNATLSAEVAELWEVARAVYNAFNRDAAEDDALDNVGALTGSRRKSARPSTVTMTIALSGSFTTKTPGTMMVNPPGSPDIKFVNRDTVNPGDTSAVFVSLELGAVVANAGTLTHITTPVTGWVSATNANDATPGRLAESNEEYRASQEAELASGGASTVEAITADLRQIDGVIAVKVFENVTRTIDSNGLPPKSLECLIYDGDTPQANDLEIAQAIWASKPPGEVAGSIEVLVTDAEGEQQPVRFSRAPIRNVWIDVEVTPPDVDVDAVKQAIVDQGNKLRLGGNVTALLLRAAPLSVPNVADVPVFKLGLSHSPSGTGNIAIAPREIARFSTSRVTVNGT